MIYEEDMISDHRVQFIIMVSSPSPCSTFGKLQQLLDWSYRLHSTPLMTSNIEA